jgi:protein SCO1/2
MDSEARVPLWRNPYVWAFVIGCVTVTLMRPLLRHVPPPPPVLGTLPDFQLVDPHGAPFGSADLRGQVYVASFFFTRCPSVCPLLMTRMKQLQDRFRNDGIHGIRLVSITVDPANDTPEVLREAEPRYGVDEAHWTLLTGPPDRVRTLCVDGFHVPGFEQAYRGEGDIPHTTKVVLVDQRGRIRGYYDTDESGLDEVYWRAQHVRDDTTTGNG